MRKRRWLRRGAFFLLFLLGLYLVFWWALFNPLEGSVDNLAALVPDDVIYMLHSPWGGLRSSEFFRSHLSGGTFAESAEDALDLERSLYGPLRQAEEEINASVPGFLGKFNALDDIAGREVLLAGNFTGEGGTLSDRLLNSPWLLITRISFKVKFMEVLRYGFVRDKIPNLKAFPNYYRYDIGTEHLKPGAPEEARYQYFRRVRDVLIVSNSRTLIEKAVHLGLAGGDKEVSRENLVDGNYWFYYDLRTPPAEPGLTAWLRVARADGELGGELEGRDPAKRSATADLLRSFFPVGLTTSLTLRIGVAGSDRLPVSGAIRMADAPDSFPEWLYSFHHREGLPLSAGARELARLAPAGDTIALVLLSMPAADFLRTLTNALDAGTADVVFGKPGQRKDAMTPAALAADLGGWFADGVGVLWSRLPDVDAIDLDTWEGGNVDPLPALTLVFTRKAGLSEEALLDYFMRNHDRFGFAAAPEPVEAPVGKLYRAKWPVDRKLSLLDPGLAFLDDRFLFSTNIGQLKRVLETWVGRSGSLADSPDFTSGVDAAFPEGNLFLFLRGSALLDFVRDQRWQHAFDASTFNRQRFFNDTYIRLTEEHPDWERPKVTEETEREVERRETRAREVDFPAAVQAYTDRLFWGEPFSALTLTSAVSGDGAGRKLILRGAVDLRPAGGDAGR
ncbi:MAG: hypothetical protein MUE73_14590 [Planctomycetes bacterium]|jgi:hypothetical protein|nr:hypothetical protein [Planctomycetota bacterium]